MAWLTPGPNMLAVASATVQKGVDFGIATGLGLACSTLVWSGVAVSGVSTLFETFPDTENVLKILGSFYIGWLGMQSLKTAYSNNFFDAIYVDKNKSYVVEFFKSVVNGFFVGISNPKALLFFTVLMTSFIPPSLSDFALLSIVISCTVLGILLHSITVFLFSRERAMRIFYSWQRKITTIVGLLFFSFAGLNIFYSEF